ncbi:MAG: hypothetical protein Q7S13_04770, partial [Candidatus Omnitrophota bacterium]|nr:hypothetical protein [Candidatus Omnitrophota bacterium]
MKEKKGRSDHVKYHLDAKGCFAIDDYNHSKAFSNFFPGIAGLWGIPMWVFYVNRGQAISSFGVESKDKAFLEFQPANKAYRLTPLQGFRTLIKGKKANKEFYWEPFQINLLGTQYKKQQRMLITSHDLTLEEINVDLGIYISVNYFTLPDEPYAALVRNLTIRNLGKTSCDLEIMDGLPVIIPFGLTDGIVKNMSRTVEAWVKVSHVEEKIPYYRLNVEVSDKPQVTHIKRGNFFFSFLRQARGKQLLPPLIDPAHIFAQAHDFAVPQAFLEKTFKMPTRQFFSNRMPAAMSYARFVLKAKAEEKITSLFGHASEEEELKGIAEQALQNDLMDKKALRNKDLVSEIKNHSLTVSSSKEFNLYAQQTFLDNILRGGIPVSLNTGDGVVTLNVYSRKHGDPERDYNYFVVSPTFYSQGNGNYRDVNQNRRNDVWFNTDVMDHHVISFLNLVQADGYNPLIVKGTTFTVEHSQKLNSILRDSFAGSDIPLIKDFLKNSFLPGGLWDFMAQRKITVKIPPKEFLGRLLEICHKQELAEHGEGFWTDHWTYNLDLIESYLEIYPENLKNLLLEKNVFSFYHNGHYVLPRDQRYIFTEKGVRQYQSVMHDPKAAKPIHHKLKTKHGEGGVY